MKVLTAADIANAVANQGATFCRRRFVVVPNVSWGWGLDYEADIIAVSKARWTTEVEIKVDKADLLNDRAKRKFRRGLDPRVRQFYYAVPEHLIETALLPEIVDPRYGIVTLRAGKTDTTLIPRTRVVRKASLLAGARKVTDEELEKLLHLGLMRYWDLRLRTPSEK